MHMVETLQQESDGKMQNSMLVKKLKHIKLH